MNVFKNYKSPKVLNEIDVYTYLDYIKYPKHEVLEKIKEARRFYNIDKEKYNKIKATLPCFTLNFSFHKHKNNDSIKAATGFIYLDVDNSTHIDFNNPLLFATWKSLSDTGRGILARVNGLNRNNFKETYQKLSKALNIVSDSHAGKATQYCIHSFDSDVYINNNSTTWEATTDYWSLPPQSHNPYKKDRSEMGEGDKLRFNNLDEYDFEGKKYIFFPEEKELIAQVDVPHRIKEGGRNSILFAIAYQIKALNPDISSDTLFKIITSINNKRCSPRLSDNEVYRIIENAYNNDEPPLMLRTPRRIIFNPDTNLSQKEKMSIINPMLGARRSKKYIEKLKDIIDNWDIEIHGKLTQKKLQSASGFNIKTIEKYYKFFENERKAINSK